MTQHPELGIDFDSMDWVEVSMPKIDWAEELRKLREYIAVNPGGDELDYFGKGGQ